MIVGVCGSPRKAATEYVLRKALNMLEESGFKTEFFTVRDSRISKNGWKIIGNLKSLTLYYWQRK